MKVGLAGDAGKPLQGREQMEQNQIQREVYKQILLEELGHVKEQVQQASANGDLFTTALCMESIFVSLLSTLKVCLPDQEVASAIQEIQDAYFKR